MKNRIANPRSMTFLLALSLIAIPERAHAYLDPGTGSVVIQVIVAGLLGAIFTFKSYVRAVTSSVARLLSRQRSSSDA